MNLPPSIAELKRAYLVEELTLRQICARYGLKSIGSLAARLKRHHVPMRGAHPRKNTAQHETVWRLRAAGMTLDRIALAIGKSKTRVHTILSEARHAP